MAQIPVRSTREVEQLLSHFGLRRVRHGSGHDIWGPTPTGGTLAPLRARSSGVMQSGTVRGLLREAGISVADARAFWGLRA